MGWLACFSKSLSDSCNFEDLRTPAGGFPQEAGKNTTNNDVGSKSKYRRPQEEVLDACASTIAACTFSPPADSLTPRTTNEFSGFSVVNTNTPAPTPVLPGNVDEENVNTNKLILSSSDGGHITPVEPKNSSESTGAVKPSPEENLNNSDIGGETSCIGDHHYDDKLTDLPTIHGPAQEGLDRTDVQPISAPLPHHQEASNQCLRSTSVPGIANYSNTAKEAVTPRTKPSWRPSSNRPYLTPVTPPASTRSERSQNGSHRRHSPRKPALPALQSSSYPESHTSASSPWDNISNLPQPFRENTKLLNRALNAVFLEFCQAGAKPDAKLLDSFRFRKLCRECLALTLQDHNNSMDITFYKFKDPHTSKMSFYQFKQCLPHIAALLELTVAETKQAIVGSHNDCMSLLALPCDSEGGSSYGGEDRTSAHVGGIHPAKAGLGKSHQVPLDGTCRDSSGPFMVASETAGSRTQSGSSGPTGRPPAPSGGSSMSTHNRRVPSLPLEGSLSRSSAGLAEANKEHSACVPQKSPGRICGRTAAPPISQKSYRNTADLSRGKASGEEKSGKHVRRGSFCDYSSLQFNRS